MLDKTLFKSFNDNNIKRKKRDKEQIPKEEENWKYISVIQFVKLKWKTITNNIQTTKGDKELKVKWLRTV